MIGSNLLLDAQEATGDAVKEDVVVISLVDLALGATGLAVSHEGGRTLEVLEAHGTFHARDAVVFHDMCAEVVRVRERLPVESQNLGYRRQGKALTRM